MLGTTSRHHVQRCTTKPLVYFVACFAELTLHPPIVAELVWHLLQLSGLVAAYSSSDPCKVDLAFVAFVVNFLSESVMAILTQAPVRAQLIQFPRGGASR